MGWVGGGLAAAHVTLRASITRSDTKWPPSGSVLVGKGRLGAFTASSVGLKTLVLLRSRAAAGPTGCALQSLSRTGNTIAKVKG